jgi:alcohol dehydrogenase class IV
MGGMVRPFTGTAQNIFGDEAIMIKAMRFHGDRIVVGMGSIAFLKTLGLKRAFIVTGGSSMQKNGTLAKAQAILKESGCESHVFSGVPANAPLECVNEGIARMREFRPDSVIALGGGSAIDAAKAMSLYYEYPELDLVTSFEQASLPQARKSIKLIAIPSTSGTASEVSWVSVVALKQENMKITGRTQAFVPDYAILDGEITLSMPPKVVAETGMDAVGHAVESYIAKNNNDFMEVLAAGAVEGLFKYLPLSYKTGDPYARERVHNLQCMTGIAFSNTGLGMNHGICHSVCGRYDVGHGLAVGIGLPYVMECYAKDPEIAEKLAYLGKRIGRDNFLEAIRELRRELNIPNCFKDAGVPSEDFYKHFDDVALNSRKSPPSKNPNYPAITDEDLRKLLIRMYEGK